jgi:hypothetical protein
MHHNARPRAAFLASSWQLAAGKTYSVYEQWTDCWSSVVPVYPPRHCRPSDPTGVEGSEWAAALLDLGQTCGLGRQCGIVASDVSYSLLQFWQYMQLLGIWELSTAASPRRRRRSSLGVPGVNFQAFQSCPALHQWSCRFICVCIDSLFHICKYCTHIYKHNTCIYDIT